MKAFARERIFEPLGMMDTHFHDDPGHIVKNRTYAYSPRQGGFRINIPDFENYGATSLFTNVGDLARWANNFEHTRVGGRAGIEMLLTRAVLNDGEAIDYALGIQHGQHRGLRTVGHGGSDAGYRSAFTTYPDQRTAIVVLSNVSTGNPGGLAREVAEVLLADAFTEAPPEPQRRERPERERRELSREQLTEYVGLYYSLELDVRYEVILEDDSLVLKRRKFSDRALTPTSEDLFEGGNRLQFTRDVTGRVDGFGLSTGRVRNLRFEKID
jgi:CubicO group peptidase (beta-lactamase class C family)